MIHVFSKQLQDYCAKRLAEGITLTNLYAEITAPEFPHKYGASYSQFTRQVASKITPDMIDSYRATMDFTDPQKQVAYLSKLISDGIGSETDRLRALTLLREIQTEIAAKSPPTSTAGEELPDRENQRFNALFFGQLKTALVLRCLAGFKGWDKLELEELQMLVVNLLWIVAEKTNVPLNVVTLAAQVSALSLIDQKRLFSGFLDHPYSNSFDENVAVLRAAFAALAPFVVEKVYQQYMAEIGATVPPALDSLAGIETTRMKIKRLRLELSALTPEELEMIYKENYELNEDETKSDDQD